jgi:thioredoxin
LAKRRSSPVGTFFPRVARTPGCLLPLALVYLISCRSRFFLHLPTQHKIVEMERLLKKHADETGLPVVADFYSDSCGPCRMMAPIYKKMAAQYVDKAVFVKIDTNAQHDVSSKYQIRSLPTFMTFVSGRVSQTQMGGIGEGGLRQMVDAAIRAAELDNALLSLEALTKYYERVDPSKSAKEVETVHQKCADMTAKGGAHKALCAGPAANQLVRRLRQKYKQVPETTARFTKEDQKAKSSHGGPDPSSSNSQQSTSSRGSSSSSSSSPSQPNLHLATIDQLREELERRLDEERERIVESEADDDDEADPDFRRWTKGEFPERLVIVGGGPAGMAAALYGARAGLRPLVVAPSMGGQLLAKGVDVENYPGVHNSTGPGLISLMRKQAAHYGAVFEDDVVVAINASARPFQIHTNSTGIIDAHSIIISTGAEANWLGVKGEYEMRGGGVSSCATCDGFLFAGQDVLVVGCVEM